MKLNRISWLDYFMLMAKVAALRSTCNSRPTGAVAVRDRRIVATGYNGSLPGASQCLDSGPNYCMRRIMDAPEEDKYNYCPSQHAEANIVTQAAEQGISLKGTTVFCTLSPCLVCGKLLKAAGVEKVYYELEYSSSDNVRDRRWMEFNKSQLHAERLQIEYDYQIPVLTSERRL